MTRASVSSTRFPSARPARFLPWARANITAEVHESEAEKRANSRREQLMEQTRRDFESETRRAIQEIRKEVADLTVMATEKVTRKTLSEDDQRGLVEDAIRELDFSALSGGEEH